MKYPTLKTKQHGVLADRNAKTTDGKTYIKDTTNNGDDNNHLYEMVISKRPHKKYVYKDNSKKESKLRPKVNNKEEYDYQDRNENTKPRIISEKSTPKRKNPVRQLKLVSMKIKPKTLKQKSSPKSKSRPTNYLDKRFDTQELNANKVIYDTKHNVNKNNEKFHDVANRPELISTLGYAEKFLNEDLIYY